jgi:hypothetical protein
MATSKAHPVNASFPATSSEPNGSPVKGIGSQQPVHDDSLGTVDNLSGPSEDYLSPNVIALLSANSDEKQKRLAQVVPKRPKSSEIANEDKPWEAKNILSFGMLIFTAEECEGIC